MYLKVYKVDNEVVVAVCDEKYLGMELSDDQAQLKVTDKFYGRETASCEQVVAALKEATIGNLVGEESVACAVSAGLIDASCVIYVQDVPHAQLVCIP